MPVSPAIRRERADALPHLPEAALECAPDGEVIAANDLALRMFGLGADERAAEEADCALEDAGDLDELYRLADVALYEAKALGRNRCVRHDPR